MAKDKTTYVWKDRKRIIFGLPWSFTVYKLTEEKMFIETGFFSKKEEEIRLYRVMDLTLKRPFGQRIWGLGTIHCCTADKSTPEFDILKVKKAKDTILYGIIGLVICVLAFAIVNFVISALPASQT